jgi:hypothetical protein
VGRRLRCFGTSCKPNSMRTPRVITQANIGDWLQNSVVHRVGRSEKGRGRLEPSWWVLHARYCSISFNSYGHMSHGQKSTKFFRKSPSHRGNFGLSRASRALPSVAGGSISLKGTGYERFNSYDGVTPQTTLRIERNTTVYARLAKPDKALQDNLHLARALAYLCLSYKALTTHYDVKLL